MRVLRKDHVVPPPDKPIIQCCRDTGETRARCHFIRTRSVRQCLDQTHHRRPAMATLDATAYPHIFERVRAHAGYDLLIRLRLVNRASSALATAALFTHVIITRAEDVTILRKEAPPPRLILLSSTGG